MGEAIDSGWRGLFACSVYWTFVVVSVAGVIWVGLFCVNLRAPHSQEPLITIGGVLLSALFRLIVAPGSACLLPERSNYDRIGVADGNRYLRFCIWQASTNRRTSTSEYQREANFLDAKKPGLPDQGAMVYDWLIESRCRLG